MDDVEPESEDEDPEEAEDATGLVPKLGANQVFGRLRPLTREPLNEAPIDPPVLTSVGLLGF